jgi:hypothetical protein
MELQFFGPLEKTLPQVMQVNHSKLQDPWLLTVLLGATFIGGVAVWANETRKRKRAFNQMGHRHMHDGAKESTLFILRK